MHGVECGFTMQGSADSEQFGSEHRPEWSSASLLVQGLGFRILGVEGL